MRSFKFSPSLLRFARALCVALPMSMLAEQKSAQACLWDSEVFFAEEQRLPCFSRVLSGTFPTHSAQYYQTRLRAAELLLAVDPTNPDALDMRGVAQLKLGKFADAERTMLQRAEVFPDAYALSANLGTIYTFNGQLEKALPYIDKAMAIEPGAHFGRERYHKLFVQYLLALKADPKKAKDNFLNVAVSAADIAPQSVPSLDSKLAAAGLSRDVFEAIDAMITVYGAAENPYLYSAAGDLLGLDGHFVYAAIAYRAVIARRHPERALLATRATEFERRKGIVNVRPDGLGGEPDKDGYMKHSVAEYLYTETHPEMNRGSSRPVQRMPSTRRSSSRKGSRCGHKRAWRPCMPSKIGSKRVVRLETYLAIPMQGWRLLRLAPLRPQQANCRLCPIRARRPTRSPQPLHQGVPNEALCVVVRPRRREFRVRSCLSGRRSAACQTARYKFSIRGADCVRNGSSGGPARYK